MAHLFRLARRFCTQKPPGSPEISATFQAMLDNLNIRLGTNKPKSKSLDESPDHEDHLKNQQEEYQGEGYSGEEEQKYLKETTRNKKSQKEAAKEEKLDSGVRARRTPIMLKKIRDVVSFEMPGGEIATTFYEHHKESEESLRKQEEEAINEYIKGERNVERKLVDPKFSFKIGELFELIERSNNEMDEKLNADTIRRDSDKIADKIEQYKKEYEQNGQEGDEEAFWKLVQAYPGSRLGPHPSDDAESFFKYIQGKVPASIKQAYRKKTGTFFESEEEKDEDQSQQEQMEAQMNEKDADINDSEMQIPQANARRRKNHDRKTSVTFRDGLSEDRNLEGYLEGSWRYTDSHNTFRVDEETLPVLPDFQIKDYQSNWQSWILWQKFCYYHQLSILKDEVEKNFNQFLSLPLNQKTKPLGSLFNYFKTLPQFLQEHEGVKNVYLGLEYKSPQWSIPEKEQALNRAAYMCLPLDTASAMMIDEHYSMDKYRLSAYEVERIMNIKTEFTFEIEDFHNELKDEKLRGQRVVENKNIHPLETPPPFVSFREAPKLPVDFYDNEDGFWNDYVKEKMNRGAPAMKGRKYFKH